MKIAGFQKTSLIDYPGKIVSIIFTQGCNFRCPYCHNADLIRTEDAGSNFLAVKELKLFLEKRKNLIDGVSITGGEPTLQPDLIEFIKDLKKMDLLLKLDTNGSRPDKIKVLIEEEILDYLAMDIKAPLGKYELAAGSGRYTAEVKESVNIIMNSDLDYEFRTTVVPGLHEVEDIKEIAHLVEGAEIFYLQNFRPINTFNSDYMKRRSLSPAELNEFKEELRPLVKKVEIRN